MVLGIYKRNKPKEKWSLYYIATTLAAAKQYSIKIQNLAKESGYDEAESAIQEFPNAFDIPASLKDVKPEKLLYN